MKYFYQHLMLVVMTINKNKNKKFCQARAEN
jgi:hypothetical protein